jgi:hypothetical protein
LHSSLATECGFSRASREREKRRKKNTFNMILVYILFIFFLIYDAHYTLFACARSRLKVWGIRLCLREYR